MANGVSINVHTQSALFADQTVGFSNAQAARKAAGAQFVGAKEASAKRQAPSWAKNAGAPSSVSSSNAAASSSSSSSATKKELKYNHKAFTRKIMQAKTPAMATMVAAQIRVKISDLERKLQSDEYDAEEVLSALAHATAMEAAAQSRANNLKLEEEAERKAKREETAALTEGELSLEEDPMADVIEDMEEEIKKEMDEEMKAVLQDMQEEMTKMMEEMAENEAFYDALDELNEAMSGDMSPEDIEAMKKRHRAEENGAIGRADMEYLKFKFQQLQAQKNAAAAGGFSASSAPSTAFSSAHIATGASVTYTPSVASVPHIAVSPQQSVINVEA